MRKPRPPTTTPDDLQGLWIDVANTSAAARRCPHSKFPRRDEPETCSQCLGVQVKRTRTAPLLEDSRESDRAVDRAVAACRISRSRDSAMPRVKPRERPAVLAEHIVEATDAIERVRDSFGARRSFTPRGKVGS